MRASFFPVAVAFALAALCAAGDQTAFAQDKGPGPSEAPSADSARRKPPTYTLESLEIRGSTRMSASQLAAELDLVPGTPLNDQLVMETRSRLLGLGLFKSVILIMRKGKTAGTARLIVDLEDDDGVLTDWALGGELGVTASEKAASAVDANTAPLDYRIGLIGRNVFGELHRGSLLVDFDSKGKFRAGQVAYGLPRFTREDVQFDAEIAAVNARYRYLDALGFGGRGQGLWSRTLTSFGELQYGAAMYTNRKMSDFLVPGFPAAVVGPKIAYRRETRLRSFFPGSGNLFEAALLLAPTRSDRSVLELSVAQTFDLAERVYLTFDTKMLAVGVQDVALRGEGRIDVPLGHASPGEDQAEIFLRLRGGFDRSSYEESERRNEGLEDSKVKRAKLSGSAAIFGVRYHSSGFIAELALKVTHSPGELSSRDLGGSDTRLPQHQGKPL